jgi:hypothetical protein
MEPIIKLCKRCGRKLKSAESRERGYGKSCWEKAQTTLKPLFRIDDKGVDKEETV